MQNSSLYCPNRTPQAVQNAKPPYCTARFSLCEQCKLQNCPSVLPNSHAAGSTNCKTLSLHCPNRTPRAVPQAKTHKGTAISQPPTKSQAVLETIFRSNTARIPHHWQCQNQTPPTALPILPNTSTHRQCQRAIINSPLPPCTLRSLHQHNQAPSRKSSHQPSPYKPELRSNLPIPLPSHTKKTQPPGKPQGLGQTLYLS